MTTHYPAARTSAMGRRQFLAGAAAVAAVAGGRAAAQPAAAATEATMERRPNILLIICDQLSIDAISAYRSRFGERGYLAPWVETPNLDRLIAGGTSFVNSYAPNPVCSPCRSCLFTGRYSTETGVIVNNVGIDRDVPNMGQWLGEHTRHRRLYCGKWHAGGPWNNAHRRGPRTIPGFEILPNGPDIFGRNMDYGISTAVEAFLRTDKHEDPFLMVASFMDPHDICFWTPGLDNGRTFKEDFFQLGDNLPPLPPNHDYDFPEVFPESRIGPAAFSETQWRHYIHDYCRMVERLDANVGRLLRAVEDRGDNTVVIFTSDHGDGLGRHRRVQKWDGFLSDTRVPLVLHGPKAGIRRGVVDETSIVNGVDIMATVCDLAGAPPPPNARGQSLLPVARGEAPRGREFTYVEFRIVGRMVIDERFKYTTAYELSPEGQRPSREGVFLTAEGTPTEFLPGDSARLRRMPQRMLFDIKADPWETANLAADPRHAGTIALMEERLASVEAGIIPGHSHTIPA